MHNAAYTIEYVLYMQSQTHTDYTRECKTEKMLFCFIVNTTVLERFNNFIKLWFQRIQSENLYKLEVKHLNFIKLYFQQLQF